MRQLLSKAHCYQQRQSLAKFGFCWLFCSLKWLLSFESCEGWMSSHRVLSHCHSLGGEKSATHKKTVVSFSNKRPLESEAIFQSVLDTKKLCYEWLYEQNISQIYNDPFMKNVYKLKANWILCLRIASTILTDTSAAHTVWQA